MVLRRGRRPAGDGGAVAVVVVAFASVVFVFAAIIVDLGYARVVRRDAQNAADAAALAAANVLYSGTTPDFAAAVAAAETYAGRNFGTTDAAWTSCATSEPLTHQPAGHPCISFDSATAPANVRVVLPTRHVWSFFGGAVGYQGMDVTALAQAQVEHDPDPACAFCVLGVRQHELHNGNISVTGGDVWVNGSLQVGPNGAVGASGGTVHVDESVDYPNRLTDPKVLQDDTVQDPLSGLPVPPSDLGLLSAVPKLDPCTQGPGFYGGLVLAGGARCVLTPGLYVFTEPVVISGNADLVAEGVTLYFACGVLGVPSPCVSDPAPGFLDAAGTGTFTVTAPSSGPRKGLAVVYDRGNTATLSLRGNVLAGSGTRGTVYAPDATLDIRGSTCPVARSMIVVAGVRLAGNTSCITTTYTEADNVTILPESAGLVR